VPLTSEMSAACSPRPPHWYPESLRSSPSKTCRSRAFALCICVWTRPYRHG